MNVLKKFGVSVALLVIGLFATDFHQFSNMRAMEKIAVSDRSVSLLKVVVCPGERLLRWCAFLMD